jgi:predicted nucleic acid-binding protein
MNTVVIDANKVFSSLVRHNSPTLHTILTTEVKLFAPDFLFLEIYRHKERLMEATHLNQNEFYETFELLFAHLRFFTMRDVNLRHFIQAFEWCKDVDLKDTNYVALALHLETKIWSGDLELKNGLRSKGVDIFIDL